MVRVVLVVDDEPLVLDLTADMLADLGFEVVTANGGRQALAKLVADPRIEILITDMNMPGMDGYQLAQEAKQIREGLQLIGLSGLQRTGCGFPIIGKPFRPDDLTRTMQRLGLY
jgi:two-component system cell cycle response regulator CpdR